MITKCNSTASTLNEATKEFSIEPESRVVRNWDGLGVVCAILTLNEPPGYIVASRDAAGILRGPGRAGVDGTTNWRRLSDRLYGARSLRTTSGHPETGAVFANPRGCRAS